MAPDGSSSDRIAQQVLGYLAARPQSTADEIAAGIGAHRTTVFRLLSAKNQESNLRLVVDGDRGFPERFWLMNDVTPLLIAVDIGARHWRVASTFSAKGGGPPFGDYPFDDDPHGGVKKISEGSAGAYDVTSIAGLLVGVPWPVTDDGQILGEGKWSGFTIHRAFEQALGLKLKMRIESDVNLGAIAEFDAAKQRHTPAPIRPPSLLYVK